MKHRRTYKHQHEGGPFAELVLRWRKERGLSQAKAAAALGIHLRTWQDWEYGAKLPKGLALELITRRLTDADLGTAATLAAGRAKRKRLNDGGAGGTFKPKTVKLTADAPTATFTYTPPERRK